MKLRWEPDHNEDRLGKCFDLRDDDEQGKIVAWIITDRSTDKWWFDIQAIPDRTLLDTTDADEAMALATVLFRMGA